MSLPAPPPGLSAKPRILLGITGGVAAYKAADLSRRLLERASASLACT